ncbi:tRNA methyltransferase complex GCD14 subunit-domain-containing protein [Phellopilus nigrolimitatus]|nr:tRNA methyltransferase complex GCD14 subunit-domain-containing protein [Phellopilus nigrolimitatus]
MAPKSARAMERALFISYALRPSSGPWLSHIALKFCILPDIAFVVSYLNIKPGSQVIEAGTGSGSFSHSVARTIGSSGHLYSYEFHEARATKARDEFRGHGLSDIITLTHRNVCKDGFTVIDQVDSVFLDLPAPWDAVQHAKKALRKDRPSRICCFSPCMEQVLRTVAALNEAGFTDITMYETLLRPHEVHAIPLLPINEVGDRLKRSEIRREEKRLKQVALSQTKRDNSSKKRKRGPRENDDSSEHRIDEEAYARHVDAQEPVDTEESRTEVKKLRTEEGVDGDHTLPFKVECVDQSFSESNSERAQNSVALSAEAESVVKSLPEKAEEPEVTVTQRASKDDRFESRQRSARAYIISHLRRSPPNYVAKWKR